MSATTSAFSSPQVKNPAQGYGELEAKKEKAQTPPHNSTAITEVVKNKFQPTSFNPKSHIKEESEEVRKRKFTSLANSQNQEPSLRPSSSSPLSMGDILPLVDRVATPKANVNGSPTSPLFHTPLPSTPSPSLGLRSSPHFFQSLATTEEGRALSRHKKMERKLTRKLLEQANIKESRFTTEICNFFQEKGVFLEKFLGSGASGQVFLSSYREKKHALKVINYDLAEAKNTLNKLIFNPQIKRGEGLGLKLPDHPNLMKVSAFITMDRESHEFQIRTKLSSESDNQCIVGIFSEYLPDSIELFDAITNKSNPPSFKQVIYINKCIASALAAMHAAGTMHRDLKPENILTNDSLSVVKLFDYGMARLWKKGETIKTSCGSPHYVAPELIIENPEYSKPADVFSFGVLLFVTTMKFFPWEKCDNLPALINEIDNFRKKNWSIKELIEGNGIISSWSQKAEILRKNDRTFAEKEGHLTNLLERTIVADPSKRLTFQQITEHPLFK